MATLLFHVVPNAKKDAVVGRHGPAIKIKLRARPIEGEANATLRRFLAGELNLSQRAIKIRHGEKSRDKLIEIETLDEKTIQERLLGQKDS